MGKKGKKGSHKGTSGKASRKQLKKQTPSQAVDEPVTCTQCNEPDLNDIAGPSTSTQRPQVTAPDAQELERMTDEETEKWETLVAFIKENYEQSSQYKQHVKTTGFSKSMSDFELIITAVKDLAVSNTLSLTSSSSQPQVTTESIVFSDNYPFKWPKTKMKVPHIFIHSVHELKNTLYRAVSRNIKIHPAESKGGYAKLLCPTFEDHNKLKDYLKEQQIPYHSYGYSKMMKVVIKGIPINIDSCKVSAVLQEANIPVSAFNDMKMNSNVAKFAKYKSVLVKVPENIEGRKLLKLKSIFGQTVKVERLLPRTKQCHRCQRWGHVQMQCQGLVRCVKCAGNHFSKDCTRDPARDPLKCANCGGEHTASFRGCPFCPDSKEYKDGQNKWRPQKNAQWEKSSLPCLTLKDFRIKSY